MKDFGKRVEVLRVKFRAVVKGEWKDEGDGERDGKGKQQKELRSKGVQTRREERREERKADSTQQKQHHKALQGNFFIKNTTKTTLDI